MYFDIVLMDLNEGREQDDAGNIPILPASNEFQRGLHMKKNVFQFVVLQKIHGE